MAMKQKGEITGPEKKEEASPWDAYMKANGHFIASGLFMQTVAWQVEGRRVLSVVPHPLMTDKEKVAKAVQKPLSAVQPCKLKDISQETGFPVFVCPPFGYPVDQQGRPPLLLIDSSVVDQKRPLLFDCGTTGVSLSVSEFLRSTSACCVEQLSTDRRVDGTASPEPAPEPPIMT